MEVALGVEADNGPAIIRKQVRDDDADPFTRTRTRTKQDVAVIGQANQRAFEGPTQDESTVGQHPGGSHRLLCHPRCRPVSGTRSTPPPAIKHERRTSQEQ